MQGIKQIREKGKRKVKGVLEKLIFDIKTPIGRKVDLVLIVLVLLSTCAVMLESVEDVNATTRRWLVYVEWFFTVIFTIEYILRIKSATNKKKYIFSFFGIIDLISILPTYASLVTTGIGSPLIIRSVRLIRIFRSLKLIRFLQEGQLLLNALKSSWKKITVFLFTSLTFSLVAGTIMFLVEGKENGFNSIPHSVYWAIVTLTTVGYGDISPHTPLGQAIASLIMVVGYGIIAVPTGLVAAEMVYSRKGPTEREKHCPSCCHLGQHEKDALFCRYCGTKLSPLMTLEGEEPEKKKK